jgi:hypothetical protein
VSLSAGRFCCFAPSLVYQCKSVILPLKIPRYLPLCEGGFEVRPELGDGTKRRLERRQDVCRDKSKTSPNGQHGSRAKNAPHFLRGGVFRPLWVGMHTESAL